MTQKHKISNISVVTAAMLGVTFAQLKHTGCVIYCRSSFYVIDPRFT